MNPAVVPARTVLAQDESPTTVCPVWKSLHNPDRQSAFSLLASPPGGFIRSGSRRVTADSSQNETLQPVGPGEFSFGAFDNNCAEAIDVILADKRMRITSL